MTHPDTLQISRAVVEQALKRAYQLGQTYWQQADSDSWTQNKKSDETQVHFNALVTKTCEALQPQAAEGCGEAGCAEGRCGTTECLPSFKAKKAAAEPVEWVHDCNALCVNNLRLWVDRCPHCGKPRNTPPATQSALTAALEALKAQPRVTREVWKDGIDIDVAVPHTKLRDAAIVQLEALGE